MKLNSKKRGFTLMEMLVVIGIIAVLMGALSLSFLKFARNADKANDQELVSNVASALQVVLRQNDGRWPRALVEGAGSTLLDENAARGLIKYRKNENGTYNLVYNPLGLVHDQKLALSSGKIVLTGVNTCGILTVGGVKRAKTAGTSYKVDKNAYVLHYAIDDDGDGITVVKDAEETIKVRANAAVWAPNPSGVVVLSGRGSGEKMTSAKSWTIGQQVDQ